MIASAVLRSWHHRHDDREPRIGGCRAAAINRRSSSRSSNTATTPAGRQPMAVRRLVGFAPNWLGDAVMSLPAIADVHRAMPDTQIDVAARAAVAPLFTMAPGIDDVVTIQDRAAAVRQLRERSYDAALLLPNSFNAAFIA